MLAALPAKAVKAVAFNLDPRNAEVYILAGGYLVEVEPRKIDSEFIDQSRREDVDEGNSLNLVQGLNV